MQNDVECVVPRLALEILASSLPLSYIEDPQFNLPFPSQMHSHTFHPARD